MDVASSRLLPRIDCRIALKLVFPVITDHLSQSVRIGDGPLKDRAPLQDEPVSEVLKPVIRRAIVDEVGGTPEISAIRRPLRFVSAEIELVDFVGLHLGRPADQGSVATLEAITLAPIDEPPERLTHQP